MKRYSIGKNSINITNLHSTLAYIESAINQKDYGYICVTEIRTVYLANHDDEYLKIQNNSLMTVPDGIPLVWIAHNYGYKQVGRVTGIELMEAILNISKEKQYSHYFYGSTNQTIDQLKLKLKHKYDGVVIKGTVSPPFQPLEQFDIDELANELNQLQPTFFWCGLGAPKQERLMALLQPKLKATICVGVGLAFDYFVGNVKRPPKWVQKIGLEGVSRLLQQPGRISIFILNVYIHTIVLLLKSLKARI